MDVEAFAAFQAQAAAFGFALHPTDVAPPYAPPESKASSTVEKPAAAAEKPVPAATKKPAARSKPATRPKPVMHAAPAQTTQHVTSQASKHPVAMPAIPTVHAAPAALVTCATSAAPAVRAAPAVLATRAASVTPATRPTPAVPVTRACAAMAAPAACVTAAALPAVSTAPAALASSGQAALHSAPSSRVAPSGRVASANRARSATPIMQLYPAALSQADHEALHNKLLGMRAHLPSFVVKWVPNRPNGSPGRGDYNLEDTFELTSDEYWTIWNICKHTLLRTPGIDMTKPITLQQPKGIVRKVVNKLVLIFPEFDAYSLVDHYVLEDFCHAILRSSSSNYKQKQKNPPHKSRKRGKRNIKSEEVEVMLDEVTDVVNEVANEVANEDTTEPLNNLDEVMDNIVNDAGSDLGMWDDVEHEPIVAPAPTVTLANDPTDDMIGNFSTMSMQLADDDEADTGPLSTNILPQALLSPVPMQMSPPRTKPNLVPGSTLPAAHTPCCAATPAVPSVSTTTSTATSTASTMSTSTASSTVTSVGAPARRPPGTPKSPGFYINSKMLGQMEQILELPEDERASHISSVLENLLLGMAKAKPSATNPTSSAGWGNANAKMKAPLEFKSEPESEDLQDAGDSDSLSDPPAVDGGDVGGGGKSGSRRKAGNGS
ncbi:hypothetical protein FRC08_001640 [Ceratobasidium sp. 394]|nr:hypothetical protein FRC08_001640 [Ceratobasidium sp. 394]